MLIATEPGINVFVGGAGLAGQITALQSIRGTSGSAVDGDIAQHAVHQVGVARVNGLQRLVPGDHRLGLRQHLILAVTDFTDDIGLNPIASIGKNRVGGDHLPGGDRTGTERHGQVGRVLVGVKAETGGVVLDEMHTTGL